MATSTATRRRPRAASAGNGSSNGAAPSPGAAASLDALLSDAVLGPGQRIVPGWPGVKLGARLAVRPDRAARRGVGLAVELARIGLGRSEVAPSDKDRRFKDAAWEGNPGLRRLCQAYLAVGQALDGLISDGELDWRSERRVRFAVENLLDALAPSNFLLTNPTALKATLDTGGGNLLRGARNFARDMASRPRVPSMVDSSGFRLGENIAVTPGAVVLRTPVFELIQYRPSCSRVRERPLLIVPPQINKYYVVDMAPDRSMVEHLVDSGQQVFVLSWRNPDERHADWDLDTYVGAVVEALDALEAITGSDSTQLLGLCAGGITASTTTAHLAARGELDRVAGLSLAVTVIDNERGGTAGAFIDRGTAALALAESARKGYLDGRSLAGVFAWLRPNDLVWGYVVNNYLLGKDPPAFDVLHWNADTVRLSAGLHRDFMELGLDNTLTRPGEKTVLGTPIDLGSIAVDTYLVAGIADHISPWQDCYRTVHLLGSEPRFVLSTSGHVAAMVNPPGNEKSTFRVREGNPEDAEAWLEGAREAPGTWWDDFAEWLGERSGAERAAPRRLGGRGYEALDDAPGTYVREV